jgi:hypothetical protein
MGKILNQRRRKMGNRIAIWGVFSAVLAGFLLIENVYRYFIIHIFNWCPINAEEICMGQSIIKLAIYFILFLLFILALSEGAVRTIGKHKEKNSLVIEEDTDNPLITSIVIMNNSYKIIENCSVELIRVNVLNNEACSMFFDNSTNRELPRLFVWENGLENIDFPKGTPIPLKISFLESAEKITLSTKKKMNYLYLFQDIENGYLAKKARYQIEIKFSGNIQDYGISRRIENTSFWEIKYHYEGHPKLPNISMKKIYEMKEPNELHLGTPFSQQNDFKLVVSNFETKSKK